MDGATRGQVVVITGASAGLGRAIVREFAKRRASIGLIARGEAGLEGARREVEEMGGRALVLPLDVADAQAVENAAERVERELGPIDLWINNAMVSVFSPFLKMTAEEFRRVTEVTYLGYVYGTMSALRRMVPRNRGVIVQVGSALAYRGIPLQSAYCGAKHAIEGFTESVRTELMHDDVNVRLTMVQMPAINTPQFRWTLSRLPRKSQPVPPIFQPELAGQAVVWAADHDRREIYVTFQTSKVIVGNKIAPALGDWYLAKTGFEAQMTDEPADPHQEHNLWRPVNEDRGAHGVFDHRAKNFSWQFWARRHPGLVALAGLGVAGLTMAAASGAAEGMSRLAGKDREARDRSWLPGRARSSNGRGWLSKW